jgi:hypothetical protein
MHRQPTSEGSPLPEGEERTPRRAEGDLHDRRVRERRVWRLAILISAGLHVLLFLLWPGTGIPTSPYAAAGPRAADDRAAEGMMQAVALQSAPPDAIQPPPVPTLDVVDLPEPVDVEPDALPEVDLSEPELPEPGRGATTGTDPDDAERTGLPASAGAGDAGTTEEGLFRVVPPSPRGMIIPPTNRNLRGSQVQVWVFVNEAGRVVSDSTRLDPPTSDRRFNEQIKAEAARWVFEPARQEGKPVAAWFPYTISM